MPEAARDNTGKPMLSFILQFPTAVEALCRVKEIGAIKYERDNWKKGGKPDWEYLDAFLRHVTAFMEGEIYASDTGCTHLAHAMWNVMAIQDLNYKGVTHDPELFSAMCDYWKLRREAEAKGMKFPSVEEWMENREKAGEAFESGDVMTTEEYLDSRRDQVNTQSMHNKSREEADAPPVESLHKMELDLPEPFDHVGERVRGMARGAKDQATVEAAKGILRRLKEDVQPTKFEFSSLGVNAPGLWKTHQFEEPVTLQQGQTLVIDESAGVAKVMNEAGEQIDAVGLVTVPGVDEPVDMEFTYDRNPMEAISKEAEPGYLVGKTDRPAEELMEEARRNIAEHTKKRSEENKALDDLINHPSHRRFIKQKQDEAWRAGYREAQKDYAPPETEGCGDPECDCERYGLGS